MADPIEDAKTAAVDLLKSTLGSMWDNAKESEQFFKDIVSDMVALTTKLVKETDPAQKAILQENLAILADSAYDRAIAIGLKETSVLEGAGKQVLSVGLGLVGELLKTWSPIPLNFLKL